MLQSGDPDIESRDIGCYMEEASGSPAEIYVIGILL